MEQDLWFRKICKQRFKLAITYSIGLQYLFTAIFLVFINFSILHPIKWISDTLFLLFSFYTWLAVTPLVAAAVIHGFVLAKPCLLEIRYYPTLFSRWYRNLIQRSVLLLSCGMMGSLTAWLYTRFLDKAYRNLFLESKDQASVHNEQFIYLIMCGVFSGCYVFTQGPSNEIAMESRIVPLRKIVQFRNSLYVTLLQSMKNSFTTSIIYLGFYNIFSLFLRCKIATQLGIKLQEVSMLYNFYHIATDVRLLLYSWLLISLIISNMSLMHVLFRIFLTEPEEFTIESTENQNLSLEKPMLKDALVYTKIPLIQHLAADDLVYIADAANTQSNRRNQLYLLTNPGGHPKNWRRLCETCIKIIYEFTHDLDQSIEGIGLKSSPTMVMLGGKLRPTFSMDQERLLVRQYNQHVGVRSLSTPTLNQLSGNLGQLAQDSKKENVEDTVSALFQRIPGYNYLFEESKAAKSLHLLSVHSPLVVKITQSLAAIVSHSLTEDQFGVVQNDIPSILHILLELKKVVDKIASLNIDVRKIDRNYNALKGTVKRSLYRITIAIEPYINDLTLDSNDRDTLHTFVQFKEI